jgi:hypothetical protein
MTEEFGGRRAPLEFGEEVDNELGIPLYNKLRKMELVGNLKTSDQGPKFSHIIGNDSQVTIVDLKDLSIVVPKTNP